MQDEFHIKLKEILDDSLYVPKWVNTYAVKNKHVDILHDCFHVRIYKNGLNAAFVKKLKILLTKLREMLNITHDRINIFLLLSGNKKRINVGETFTSENINSGLSISNADPSAVHIVIYRLEDIFKVLIHEMLHYVGLDLRNTELSTIRSIDDMIKNKYKSMLHMDLHINEAYTEALALQYYCELMKKDFKLEQQHSIKQTKMFIRANRCDTLQSFQSKTDYQEKSHSFSYILLKSALINCKYALNNIKISSSDKGILCESFKRALLNNTWIRKVNEYKIDKKQTKFNMNLIHV